MTNSNNLIKLIAFGILLTISSASGQPRDSGPTKFDEFGDICCDAEKARLENYLNELQKDPTTQGYIVYYGGRFYDSCWYGGNRDGKRRPRRGEAQARAARLVPYLIEQRGLDPSRIALVDGGYRESWTAELWIVPAGAKPPAVTPTVEKKDIRYRKGGVTAREFYLQCRYPGGGQISLKV